ncbi:glycosyltransferase family 2 protein [Paenibacillus apis]|nr:glycosyltransferase family 2 protein [Paenibacillus apis]
MSSRTMTSIIIPTYNGLELLIKCIESIRKYTDVPYEIIVVDNGSNDGTKEYCRKERLILISLPENRGFPVACNKGLAVAAGEQLLLLNNDCRVTPNWLSQLLTALNSAEDIGAVGPVTNYASGEQQIAAGLGGQDDDGWIEFARIFNRTDRSKWMEVKRLIGFCLMFKRSVYERIGPLDEDFSPGHYEDDDYCYRAVKEGFRLLICKDTFIYHEGSASFRETQPQEWKLLIENNRKRFMNKWGADPRQFIQKEESS